MIDQCRPTEEAPTPFAIIGLADIGDELVSVYASDRNAETVCAVVAFADSTVDGIHAALLASSLSRQRALADRCAALYSYANEEPILDVLDD